LKNNEHKGELQMTEQELIELWGDGSEFGLSPNDELFMNNAFREVAVKFALVVADKAYWNGIERAGMDND
jgi:hypothetical protein